MRKILFGLLILITINSFGQDSYRGESQIGRFIFYGFFDNPTNYQYRVVRERSIAAMFDSSLHIPRYNGAPSGLRTGSSIQDGLIAMDTTNNIFYIYSGGSWIAQTGTNIYNSNGILTGNRTLTGLNNTYSLNFDSLNSWRVQRNGITRFSMSSTTSSMIGANTNAAFTANATQAIVNYQGNALRVAVDSSTITKILSYETNINGSLTPNAHATKSYVDSVAAASAPNLQSVTTAGNRTTNEIHLYNGTTDSLILQSTQLAVYNSFGGGSTIQPGYIVAQNAFGARWIAGNELGMSNTGSGFNTSLKHINPSASNEFYLRETNTSSHIDTLATLADVRAGGGGGSGTNNANVGSGYRWLKPSTQEIKTSFAGFGVIKDSTTNTDGITDKVDSTSGGVTSWVRTKFLIDSLQAAGWGNFSVNAQTWYQYWMDVSGSTQANFFPAATGTNAGSTITTSSFAADWISGRQQTTGTTNSGRAYIYFGSGSGYAPIAISSSYRYNYGVKVRLEDLSDVTETYEVYAGFGDDANIFSSVVDGAGFRYTNADSSGKWIMWAESNSSLTQVTTTTTVAADTDYELEISVFGGVAYYYINKVLAGTISTNIPSGTTRATSTQCTIRKTNGTTARLMYVEWLALGKRSN